VWISPQSGVRRLGWEYTDFVEDDKGRGFYFSFLTFLFFFFLHALIDVCPVLSYSLGCAPPSVPGEDPVLTSRYADAIVSGLQQPQPSPGHSSTSTTMVAAGCKHLVGNSLENWHNVTRHDFNALITADDLYNYYLPPFETCIRHSKTLGLMCSYNALNGQPACINDWLLNDVVRRDWNYTGYIVTDCGALADVVHGHHAAVDPIQASALALNASVDVNCGSGKFYPQGLLQAYEQEWVTAAKVKESFTRLARVQFQLGLFDNTHQSQNHNVASSTTESRRPVDMGIPKLVDTSEHQELAYQAALQSIVILQNNNQTLPLLQPSGENDNGVGISIAVIGPHALSARDLLSNYHGQRCNVSTTDCSTNAGSHRPECFACIPSPFQAIAKWNAPGRTQFAIGCNVSRTETNDIDEAVELARKSDVIVLVMGLDQSQECEGNDRTNTTLPGLQLDLLHQVLSAVREQEQQQQDTTTSSSSTMKTKAKKIILTLIHGGSLSLGPEITSNIPAILSLSYGGQAGSTALADVLFGAYNPTGKLAATWYPPGYIDKLPMTDMSLSTPPGRTHLHYQDTPGFEFGHGLSYSAWGLQWIDVESTMARAASGSTRGTANEGDDGSWLLTLPDLMEEGGSTSFLSRESLPQSSLTVSVEVKNLGPMDGHQTVLLFWKPIQVTVPSDVTLPRQKLIFFAGTTEQPLQVDQTKTVSWKMTLQDFALWRKSDASSDPYNATQMSQHVFPGSYLIEARAANNVTISRRLVIDSSSKVECAS
jgi:xylan 1,4-beta-xylosidase